MFITGVNFDYGFLAGIIIGLSFGLYVSISEKLLRALQYLILTSALSFLIIRVILFFIPNFDVTAYNTYLLSFILATFTSVCLVYLFHFKSKKKDRSNFTFLDYMRLGDKLFDESQNEDDFRDLYSDDKLVHQLDKFLQESTASINQDLDFQEYFLVTAYTLIVEIFGKKNKKGNGTDAVFSTKLYDEKADVMKPLYSSSKTRSPGTIDMSKTNMIMESARRGCIPLVFSQNKHFHYRTECDGIGNKFYNDYACMTLIVNNKNRKPLLSLTLETSRQEDIRLMKFLVKTGRLEKIGLNISTKFMLSRNIEGHFSVSETVENQILVKKSIKDDKDV